MSLIAFNLLLNAVFSFVAGGAIVYLALRTFRVPVSRWKLFFLILPFLKILWDLSWGVPSHSFAFTGRDPFELPQGTRFLYVSTGLTYFWPTISLFFGVQDPAGGWYAVSLADFLHFWLARRFFDGASWYLLLLFLCGAGGLFFRRFVLGWRFELERRRDRRRGGEGQCEGGVTVLEMRSVGWRRVDIYVSDHYRGSPFTGGVVRPFICFPRDSYERLAVEERDAVIRHELAHVKNFDLPVTVAIQVLGDIFWFVPGYRSLKRRIDRLREILADHAAVEEGAVPERLASALLKLRETVGAEPSAGLVTGFVSGTVREQSLLVQRVQRLLGGAPSEPVPRWGWNSRVGRGLIALWTGGAVLAATFGGYQHEPLLGAWIRSWLGH